jgi:hypothetical protein
MIDRYLFVGYLCSAALTWCLWAGNIRHCYETQWCLISPSFTDYSSGLEEAALGPVGAAVVSILPWAMDGDFPRLSLTMTPRFRDCKDIYGAHN